MRSLSLFQSTPPVKAATGMDTVAVAASLFQSTPPVKAATSTADLLFGWVVKFQSTPPVKAATLSRMNNYSWCTISIHAAREGGDPDGQEIADFFGISIHAAREGGDAREEGEQDLRRISIHAAREGGDPVVSTLKSQIKDFNPRRP